MENGRGYFQTLYQREEPHPHGLPMEKHVDNEIPLEAEVEEEMEAEVQHLHPSQGGQSYPPPRGAL